jgi:hypothetical protein
MDDDLMRLVFGETGAQQDRLPPPNYRRARERLRALLAMAKAVGRHLVWLNEAMPPEFAAPTDKALMRAYSRLERLSGRSAQAPYRLTPKGLRWTPK